MRKLRLLWIRGALLEPLQNGFRLCLTVVLLAVLMFGQQYDSRSVDENHNRQLVINAQQISTLERDVSEIKALKLDSRLATLEQSAQTNSHLLIAILLTGLGLFAEAIYRNLSARKEKR